MILKVDTDFLKENNLTLNQYFIVSILYEHHKDYVELFKLISEDTLDNDLEHLVNISYIELVNGSYKLTGVYKNLIESSIDKSYLALWHTYPSEVPKRNGGFRILRAKSTSSQDFDKGFSKYKTIVKGKPWLIPVIQTALERQLKVERQSNGLEFMQLFEVWLNQYTWEKYILEEGKTNEVKVYSNDKTKSI